jgi:hypothetical protein
MRSSYEQFIDSPTTTTTTTTTTRAGDKHRKACGEHHRFIVRWSQTFLSDFEAIVAELEDDGHQSAFRLGISSEVVASSFMESVILRLV